MNDKLTMPLATYLAKIEALALVAEEAACEAADIRCERAGMADTAGSEGKNPRIAGKSEYSYRMMVEAMNAAAIIVAPDGIIRYCNPHFEKMVRSGSSEILGKPIRMFIEALCTETTEALLQGRGVVSPGGTPRNPEVYRM